VVIGTGAAACCGAGYFFAKGKVCDVFPADFEHAWAASHRALAALGMPILKENHAKGYLVTRTTDGAKVRIHLYSCPSRIPAEGMQTQVCIRVGCFGDHPVSEHILAQIGLQLTPACSPASTGHVLPVPPASSAHLGPPDLEH
jgi:hypothetical protein